MKRFDKVLFGLFLGAIFPIMLGLLSVLIWFYIDKQEAHAPTFALIGLSCGLVIDLIFLKLWINKLYTLPIWFIAGIYILYNFCVLGFFMGFPVFNTLLGLLAGYYYGKRMFSCDFKPELRSKLISSVSVFTGLIMTLICISSGILGLTDRTIGENIREIFGLNFEITKTMLLVIIFAGGFSLIITQYYITKLTLIKTIKLNS